MSAHIQKIIRMVKDRSLDPVIVFSFSRRRAVHAPCTSPAGL